MGDLAVEGRPFTQQHSPSSSTADADSFSIGQERWAAAEIVSGGILRKVRPTAVSEERRRAVIDYVQRLVRRSLACEVFPYGSVPLKTYLPDGDIDLTAFGGPMMEDALASDLVSVLEEEGKNKGAEFIVKDVQLIRAEHPTYTDSFRSSSAFRSNCCFFLHIIRVLKRRVTVMQTLHKNEGLCLPGLFRSFCY
ncbi:unnamed protein product [Cuscuta campestris]|uniref:Polymerase nucleotidyl transferase domain-containing protein n=1 Tax=Cuscuta campestris TaxID=132261 RepID=A0A484MIS7_9ASTE|nr:unnamed protein product [Cuscuta campestris]